MTPRSPRGYIGRSVWMVLWLLCCGAAVAEELPVVGGVEFQPFAAATQRLVEAMDYVGSPLSEADQAALQEALKSGKRSEALAQIQSVLDKYCLAGVNINPESRVKVAEGPAKKELIQQGWRTFLVKVHNEAGVTGQLVAESPNAEPLVRRGRNQPRVTEQPAPGELIHRFLEISMYGDQPLKPALSGLELEYRIIQLYTRDAGKREVSLAFNVGQGTQDIGFRNEVPILFHCLPAVEVVLEVLDDDGTPTTGSFVFRDTFGRVYPAPSRRLAPDFFFHNQIYRHSGESVRLAPGKYSVEYSRGPEYLTLTREIEVPNSASHEERFELKRWIKLADLGWYSGDHHVHAAGCAHYDSPTEGVMPADMMRHILGEDLNVGCVLSWGPCWYFQKEFFEGKVNALSTPDYLMRYDVEVSGFPSSHAGHLCLLRLTEDDYTPPNGSPTSTIEEWPSWDLPVLQWGKSQNAVVGFSHSGWGLEPVTSRDKNGRPTARSEELPNYVMPPFDGIGANEYVVDVVHDAVDFISSVDTPSIWELNIWYHTLNCGFRARLSGETDFPCIYGDKVGLGRVYVKLDPDEGLDYDRWVYGVRDGRSYVGDGLSHLVDFTVGGVAVGEKGNSGEISELDLDEPETVKVTARVAAYLDEEISAEARGIRNRPLHVKPYWHVERARIGELRRVPVELIVNGQSVARKEVEADGTLRNVAFEVPIERSSWICLRILPSSHTNPVFVQVGDKPIRASRKSAQWCLEAVDVCWDAKVGRMRKSEQEAARAAYDKAREVYARIVEESEVE